MLAYPSWLSDSFCLMFGSCRLCQIYSFQNIRLLTCMEIPQPCCNYNIYPAPLDLVSHFGPDARLTGDRPCYWAHNKNIVCLNFNKILGCHWGPCDLGIISWCVDWYSKNSRTQNRGVERSAVRMCHCCSLYQWLVCHIWVGVSWFSYFSWLFVEGDD